MLPADFLRRAGADFLFDLHADGFEFEAHAFEDVDGHALAEFDQAEQQVFGADVGVVEAVRFLAGEGQDLLGAWGEVVHASPGLVGVGSGLVVVVRGIRVSGESRDCNRERTISARIASRSSGESLRPEWSCRWAGWMSISSVSQQTHGFRREKPEVAAEPQQREVVERLLGIDDMGVAQHAVGAADLVGDHLRIVLEQFFAGVVLVVGDLRDDALQAADDGFLALAEGGLVGNLDRGCRATRCLRRRGRARRGRSC